MSLVIRRATADDIDGMYRLSCDVHQTAYAHLIPADQRNRFLKAFTYSSGSRERRIARYRQDIDDPRGYAWVAVYNGSLVGFARGCWQDEQTIQGHGLFVDPPHQGRGIGEALFQRVLAQTKKGDTVRLLVIENNERAKSLYRKHGFEANGLADKAFYGAKMIIMTKHIG